MAEPEQTDGTKAAERRWQLIICACLVIDGCLLFCWGWLVVGPLERLLAYLGTFFAFAALLFYVIKLPRAEFMDVVRRLAAGRVRRSAVIAPTILALVFSGYSWWPKPQPIPSVATPTPRPTATMTPDCSAITLPASLELDLATGPAQELYALADGSIVLRPADVAGLTHLSGRAAVAAPSGCVCVWQGRTAEQPSLQRLPGLATDCSFSLRLDGATTVYLLLTVGGRQKHFRVRVEP